MSQSAFVKHEFLPRKHMNPHEAFPDLYLRQSQKTGIFLQIDFPSERGSNPKNTRLGWTIDRIYAKREACLDGANGVFLFCVVMFSTSGY
jgi:hypothetical protein